jgi:hypothetical protein
MIYRRLQHSSQALDVLGYSCSSGMIQSFLELLFHKKGKRKSGSSEKNYYEKHYGKEKAFRTHGRSP